MLGTPPAFVLSQDQTLYKMVFRVSDIESPTPKSFYLEFALSYSRNHVDFFTTFPGRFEIDQLLFDMVFVHVFVV